MPYPTTITWVSGAHILGRPQHERSRGSFAYRRGGTVPSLYRLLVLGVTRVFIASCAFIPQMVLLLRRL